MFSPEYSKEKFFSYKWSGARITIENSFVTLNARFRCLQRAMDVDIWMFISLLSITQLF